MNGYLKLAYDLGVQRAREKFAGGTSIQHQRQTPTWGLGGPLPSGFKAPPPAPLQRTAMTTQGLPPKSPLGSSTPSTQSGSAAATTARSTASIAGATARPTTSGMGGTDQGTAAGVSSKQHAWQQQASRTSASDAPANIAASKGVADVVSRGNREMGQILRDTSGNPGTPPALAGVQTPGAQPSK